MIAKHRQRFNAEFTPKKYQEFLRALNARCRTEIHFRVCETPAFFPESLINTMAEYGDDLMQQLLGNPEYMRESERSVPPQWNVPNQELLKRVIVGDHDPENVVLLEIDPEEQKTAPDFRVTEEWLKIPTVNIREVVKHGDKLHHLKAGKLVPIERIYNRTIVDELE